MNETELFEIMKEKLYTPVVGDILDAKGYMHQFLPHYIFGDVDGVIIIPKEIAQEVVEEALEKASKEKGLRKAVEGGMPVTEAFEKFGVL